MPTIFQSIASIRRWESYAGKFNLLKILNKNLSDTKISAEERNGISDFVFEEFETLISLISEAKRYEEKKSFFRYETELLCTLNMSCIPFETYLSEEQIQKVEFMVAFVKKEKFLENMIDEIFLHKKDDVESVKYLIAMTNLAMDEYHKGTLYLGMSHYQGYILNMPKESRDLLGAHMQSEMKRYVENPLTPDIESNLEMMCNVCRYFGKERFAELLKKALLIGNAHVRFQAVNTLLLFGCKVSIRFIDELAGDVEYAYMTFKMLCFFRLEKYFPSEYAAPDYLAKSQLVRWLTDPLKLGKVPNEIEYIGKIRKSGVVYVFRFRSEKNIPGHGNAGEWMIGWARLNKNAFSQYDLYKNYEQKTPEKTLRYIKKKLF